MVALRVRRGRLYQSPVSRSWRNVGYRDSHDGNRQTGVVTAGAENEDIPDAACIRIDHGLAEVDMLAEFMTWMSLRPGDARDMGTLARAHVRERHESERVARLFWSVLEESCGA